jgi:hypothetical protein
MTTFSEQFKEVHSVRGAPVRILSESGMAGLVGRRADVHMHSPATEKLGRPIFSVLVKGRVVGQTEDIHLSDARMKVDKQQLKKHLESPTGAKTRNTFLRGDVTPAPETPVTNKLRVRPGSITDNATGEDVSANIGTVRLGPSGPRYRN